ncbi:MAG: VOC family protein [Myxococcota bacterium]
MEPVRALKSVVLVTDDIDATAAFYRDALGVPLELEHHRGTARHWAGMLGDQHLAVHPREGFWLPVPATAGAEGTIVSFDVDDLDAIEARLAAHAVPVVARTHIGPMRFLAVVDPDGRHVCCGTRWPA